MDIHNCFQKIVSNNTNSITKPWKENTTEKNVLESICFTIEINNRFFVICTYHSIFNSHENYIICDDCGYELNSKKYDIPEIDVTIFEDDNKIKNIMDTYKVEDINELNINLKNINNDIFEFIIPFNDNFMSLQCTIEKFTKMKYNNICFPEMPVFIGKLTGESIEKINVNEVTIYGGSGTPIYKNNKIFGFLSGYYDSYSIVIIPIFMIKRIINEILQYNNFNGLCKAYFNVDSLNSNTFIKNMLNINYNSNMTYLNKKNIKLKKKDIILKLDNNTVINKIVYDDNLKIYIDIDTYLIINKTILCTNTYLVSRPNNKSNKIVQIITGNISINSCANININSKRINYYVIDNYIYAEICPNLFNLLLKYRSYSESDVIYSLMDLKYDKNKITILCDTKDGSYSIFNNEIVNIDVRKTKYLESIIESENDLIQQLKKIKLVK